jgi:hypothetical protein
MLISRERNLKSNPSFEKSATASSRNPTSRSQSCASAPSPSESSATSTRRCRRTSSRTLPPPLPSPPPRRLRNPPSLQRPRRRIEQDRRGVERCLPGLMGRSARCLGMYHREGGEDCLYFVVRGVFIEWYARYQHSRRSESWIALVHLPPALFGNRSSSSPSTTTSRLERPRLALQQHGQRRQPLVSWVSS